MGQYGLADAMFRQLRAHVANDPHSAGNTHEIAEALERYDRIVKYGFDVIRDEDLAIEKAIQKGADDRGAGIT